MRRYSLYAIGLGLLVVLLAYATSVFGLKTSPLTITWLIPHQPVEVYNEAKVVLEDELSREFGREVVVDIVAPYDLGLEYRPTVEYIQMLLRRGEVDLISVSSNDFSQVDPELGVFNIPYLFPDYATVEKAFDGSFGTLLLEGFEKYVDAHALAFTYSGGLKLFLSREPIHTAADLDRLRIATRGGPVAEDLLRAYGAIPFAFMDPDISNEALESLNADAVETTYARVPHVTGTDVAYASETYHWLHTTLLLAGNDFYDSLSPSEQIALQNAAKVAARTEREDSIALGETHKAALVESGVTIVPFPASSKEVLIQKAAPFVAEFESKFPGILDAAKAVR